MKKISIAIMIIVVALSSCKKTPEVNLKYVDVERDLITVGTTTATVQCDYQYIATLKKAYLCYGEGENEDNFSSAEMRVVQNTLYVDLAGLTANTTYNYYYAFHNGFNSMRTALKTFKTEGGSGPTIILPTVVTGVVTEITTSSAKGSGEVTNDGGVEVTERGICWSTNANPTLNDSHVAAGFGIGAFTAMMNGLEANTTYHVRAYATNEAGTAYGLDREFVTIGGGGSDAPTGAVDGLFSVSPTQKVYFSQGNLQYQASTNTWRFAENQWDYVGGYDFSYGNYGNVEGSSNNDISSTYSGWIDLFGWGTSGYDHGAVCSQPWDCSLIDSNYYAYGLSTYNLFDQAGKADWGYNCIVNGGNTNNLWRTLAQQEWYYVLMSRSTLSGIRFAKAIVNGVKGLVLVPDDWEESAYTLNDANNGISAFSSNTISLSIWMSIFQPLGAAFLPVTGSRYGIVFAALNNGNGGGTYHSSSAYNDESVYSFAFYEDGFFPSTTSSTYRNRGLSVRLVMDAIPQPSVITPTVNTSDVSNNTSNSAICGGEITSDGGATVIERGICWSTNADPTLDNSHIAAGTGVGVFTVTIGVLAANTTYHVRAYATNEAGTAYGLDKEFTTLSGGGGSGNPEGAINGLFTINANGDQVYFSQGNLQYQASTNTWRFAENQWNQVGGNYSSSGGGECGNVYEDGVKCDNMLVSATYSGWIDLFCWGTSGWDCGNVYYHPYDKDGEGEQYGPLGYSSLTGEYANSDWGVYNPIINGGNQSGLWRTMTLSEWYYVMSYRAQASEKLSMAKVNGVHGCVILPDEWDCPTGLSFVPQSFDWITNVYTEQQWKQMELKGAVFLPASGERNSIGLLSYDRCEYHTANASSDWSCWHFIIDISGFVGDTGYTRVLAPSVRLVQDAH